MGSQLVIWTKGKRSSKAKAVTCIRKEPWRYNEYGLVTNKLDASGTEIFRYRYDPNGRLTNRWTAEKAAAFH